MAKVLLRPIIITNTYIFLIFFKLTLVEIYIFLVPNKICNHMIMNTYIL